MQSRVGEVRSDRWSLGLHGPLAAPGPYCSPTHLTWFRPQQQKKDSL